MTHNQTGNTLYMQVIHSTVLANKSNTTLKKQANFYKTT